MMISAVLIVLIVSFHASDATVAFTATSDTHSSVADGQTVVFRNIVTNNGNAYSSTTGIFTAPHGGVYVFTSTLVSGLQSSVYAHITKGNKKVPLNSPYVSGQYVYGTNTMTLVLAANDQVSVKVMYASTNDPITSESSFSGYEL